MFECAFEARGERASEFAFEARDGRSPANFLLKIPFLLIAEDADRPIDDAGWREGGGKPRGAATIILKSGCRLHSGCFHHAKLEK